MKHIFKRFLVTNIICSVILTSLVSCFVDKEPLSYEEAYSRLCNYKVKFDELLPVEADIPNTIEYELPDIDKYPLVVEGNGSIDVEIFLHTENFSDDIVDIVSYAATIFNAEKLSIDGKIASVSIRALESNLAEEYILNETWPKGYIATNELYGYLLQEQGIELTLINEKTVENIIGIVIERDKYRQLEKEYEKVNIDTIIDASQNEIISFAYSNPVNNSVGLNFVASLFSKFNISDANCVDSIKEFSDFHKSVSLVSFDNQQIKNAIEIEEINAFVIDYQTFLKTDDLKDYKFIPFGIRADNPIYSIGELSDAENKILKRFSYYFSTTKVSEYAKELGYVSNEEYRVGWNNDINSITKIIDIWKKQRAETKDIRIAFLADISMSMKNNDKLDILKKALINSIEYIDEKSKVGLFSFNTVAFTNLNVTEFNHGHEKCFVGAIKNLEASGQTSINNALLLTHQKLLKRANSESELRIILLTDGGNNNTIEKDYKYSEIKEIIDSLNVPIYVIEYDKVTSDNILKEIANLNNGVYIKADIYNIGYIIKTLFYAES